MPNSPLLSAALKFRARLDAASQVDLDRLIAAYAQLAQRLQDKIDLLVQELLLNPGMTPAQIGRMARYKDLVEAVAAELQKYGVYLETELSVIARAALAQSEADAFALIRMALQQAGYTGAFNHLPANAIKMLLGFLQPDGALYKRIQELAPGLAQRIADKILEGVGLGYNPQKVGTLIADELGWGLTDALRWARTTQMYSYREASRANFAANSDIIDGWVWFAQLDDSTCESCVANHGQLFGLDETLDDHWNGRCVMIPHVSGDPNPVEQDGQTWFDTQDTATQKQIMGESKWQAWMDGKFEFSAMSRQTPDNIWGTMRTATPLKDLVER